MVVHRDIFLYQKQLDALISQIYFGIKLYIFRTVPLSIINSFSLYTQQWYMSYRFSDSLLAGSGWNCSSVLIPLASCQQICMTYTIAVCTVLNPWWWTEELSEVCRVLFQNKFENLVHLVGFIIRINPMNWYRNIHIRLNIAITFDGAIKLNKPS